MTSIMSKHLQRTNIRISYFRVIMGTLFEISMNPNKRNENDRGLLSMNTLMVAYGQ